MIKIIESPREGMQGFSRIIPTVEKVEYQPASPGWIQCSGNRKHGLSENYSTDGGFTGSAEKT